MASPSPDHKCLACDGTLSTAPALTGQDLMHGIPGRYEIYQCLACGSGTTFPPAGAEEISGYYPAAYAPYKQPRGPLAAAMRTMQRARDRRFPFSRLQTGPPGTLLDVGCGRGDLAASWIAAGWRAFGVEPSPDAAATARQRGVETLIGTLETVALVPASFDAAVFRHSLEHVPEPCLDLERVNAALRPGGRVAIIVPNWGSWQRRAFKERWFPLELPRHRTHFSAAGLHAALQRAGFVDVATCPGTPFITTTWSLQYLLFGRCLTKAGAALWAGYLLSAPISLLTRPIDALRGGGDFLHAVGTKPLDGPIAASTAAEAQAVRETQLAGAAAAS
jgi:SAM-dependent methyltransferase